MRNFIICIVQSEGEEVINRWRKLHNEELHNLHCSLLVIMVTKRRRMSGTRSTHAGDDVYKILDRKDGGKILTARQLLKKDSAPCSAKGLM
jgi:hypothetical protein